MRFNTRLGTILIVDLEALAMLCDFANVGDFKEHTDLESSKRWAPCDFARSRSSESIAFGSLIFVAQGSRFRSQALSGEMLS